MMTVFEEFLGQLFFAGVDGFAAAVLDQSLQEADDAVRAVEEVLGHPVLGEHAGAGVQQPQVLLDAVQMVDPGAGLRCGVVMEAVQFDQVEAPFGLCGLQVVRFGVLGGREPPLTAGGVVTALAQKSGAGDVDADEDQGDVHAHEGADQVEGVLVVGAVHAKPRDVVQDQDPGAVVPQGRGDLADQIGRSMRRPIGAPKKSRIALQVATVSAGTREPAAQGRFLRKYPFGSGYWK
ncbi:hypothetical protein [Streptomyces lydicus]|uniref:hypothetical protein n=1 Tax=Streptomyces lydicus TaxID=47763 RepID=UPI0036E04A9F